MKRAVLICSTLLACSSICLAASPDELWQKYQEHPSVVSTTPVKPVAEAKAAPQITVETADRDVVVPRQQAAASKTEAQADTANATDNPTAAKVTTEPVAKKAATDTAANPAADSATNEAAAEPATETVAISKAEAAVPNEQTTTSKEATTKAPVVSNKPVAPAAKPKPKPSLVGKPPLPKQYLRTPQAGDFVTVTSALGGYSLAVPSSFGSDPLAQLPGAAGSMLVRTASDILMLAATVLDAGDSTSYKATEPLPAYADAKLYCGWQHPGKLNWDCRLSRHNDYHGDKLLLQAQAQQAGKTYQLLFVMPKAKQDSYLAQALYSLHSFKLL